MPRRYVQFLFVLLLGTGLISSACLSTSPAASQGSTTAARPAATVGAEPTGTPAPDGTPAVSVAPLEPSPLISRGKKVVGTPDVDNPAAVVDGQYCSWPAWRTSKFPTSVAIQVGSGPSELLLRWSSNGSVYTIDGYDGPSYGIPASYRIETSADSTDGSNGTWQVVADVHDNTVRTREHKFAFSGQQWVRMTVTGTVRGTVDNTLAIQEIELFDVSRGADDSVMFAGDSITDAAYSGCENVQPSYAALVHNAHPAYYPAVINAGVGGVNSSYGDQMIDGWLKDNPDMHIWAIGYGTNDAWQSVPPDTFRTNMQTIIDEVKKAGREPVLARIPYATKGPKDENVQALNQVIDELTACNGLILGPDLYSWFKQHPTELGPDGVHPNTTGSASMNRLWYQALEPLYGGQAPKRGTPGAGCSTMSATPAAAAPATRSQPDASSPAQASLGPYLLGVNYPWQSYGNDFGQNAWGAYGVHDPSTYTKVDRDFAALAAAHVNSVRWFVFGDGRAGIRFDSAGIPQGLDDYVFQDFDAALEIAQRHNIEVDFVLLDFLFMRDARVESGVQMGGHANVINSSLGQDALITKVFDPLFERYHSNPAILSWEVMNEPELALAEVSSHDSQVSQPSSLLNFQQFTRRVVDEIHAKTTSKATLGSYSAEWVGRWTGLGLDYYQVHYYDWMSNQKAANLYAKTAADLKLDRPVVVGEFPAANSKTATLPQYLDHWASAGFAGAWVWSLNADDQVGRPNLDDISAWAAAHPR